MTEDFEEMKKRLKKRVCELYEEYKKTDLNIEELK